MNTHLFLDWAKVKIKTKHIPFQEARVAFFAPFKLAKRLITPEEPHGIYVLPEKSTAKSVMAAAEEILSHHADARLMLVSPREKWQTVMYDLQQRYPQARIVVKKRLSKKSRAWFASADEHQQAEKPLSNKVHHQDNQLDNRVVDEIDITAIAERVQAASREMAPSSPEVFTLLASQELPPINLQPVLTRLRKNRPKKKADLVQFLTACLHNEESAQRALAQLTVQGVVQMDVAENVRYRFE